MFKATLLLQLALVLTVQLCSTAPISKPFPQFCRETYTYIVCVMLAIAIMLQDSTE